MFCRLRQLLRTLRPRFRAEERAWVQTFLPAEAWALFQRQSLPEQRHALDVAATLSADAALLPLSERCWLLTAALLHDCGKAQVQIHLKHRILAVILASLPHPLSAFWKKHSASARFAWTVHVEHPLWGSRLASEAGLDEPVRRLIFEHHTPHDRLALLLAQADNRC